MNMAWKQIVAALVLGGALGFLGARVVAPHAWHRHWKPGQFQAQLLERFSRKLNLTAQQRTQVAAILEAKHQKVEALRSEFQPRFKEIRTSTMAEIRPLLTPEQQQKFDVMNAKFEQRAKQFCWGEGKEVKK